MSPGAPARVAGVPTLGGHRLLDCSEQCAVLAQLSRSCRTGITADHYHSTVHTINNKREAYDTTVYDTELGRVA